MITHICSESGSCKSQFCKCRFVHEYDAAYCDSPCQSHETARCLEVDVMPVTEQERSIKIRSLSGSTVIVIDADGHVRGFRVNKRMFRLSSNPDPIDKRMILQEADNNDGKLQMHELEWTSCPVVDLYCESCENWTTLQNEIGPCNHTDNLMFTHDGCEYWKERKR
jgi:hypothetical protein